MKLLFPLLLPIALGTCGILSNPGSVPVRIAVNVGSLAGAIQEDFNSVMDRVDLIITDVDGAQQTLSIQLDPGEVDPAFDVEVQEGLATFTVTVVSTDGLPLYEGTTTSTIDRDGFEVTIVPEAVRGVLVVSPQDPEFEFLRNTGSAQLYGAVMAVRNPGSGEVVWRVLSSPDPNRFLIACEIDAEDDVGQFDCLEFTNIVPNGQLTIRVSFAVLGGGPVPGSGVGFDSNVGDLTVATTP